MEMKRRELDSVLSNWGISDYTYKKIELGYINDNWFVESNGKRYILRKVSNFGKDTLSFELKYLSDLKSCGFEYSIPAPLKTKSGTNEINNNGIIFWLYEYIEGGHEYKVDKAELIEIAGMIASYHKAIMNNKSMFISNAKANDPFKIENAIVDINKTLSDMDRKGKLSEEEMTFVENMKKLMPIANALSGSTAQGLELYFLHGDMRETNLIWQDKELVGLIDFDFVRYSNILMKDLVSVLRRYCLDKEKNYLLNMEMTKLLINEYSKERKLVDGEIKALVDTIIEFAIADFRFLFLLRQNSPEKGVTMDDVMACAKMAEHVYANRAEIYNALDSHGT